VEVAALEQSAIGQRNGDEVGIPITIELDANLREFREPDREVGFAVRIVGRPALPAGFAAIAGVDAATEVETLAEGVLVG
jgi:hypothetical protein